jgi:hypothetical protein
MEKTMNAKPSSKASTVVGVTAVTIVLAAVYLVFFTPATVLWGVIWNQMNAPSLARQKHREELKAAFRASWEGKCAQTPAGKIGYPLASNFSGFYLPNSLYLDFKEGSKASYDLDDLKAVDCPQNPKA